jgi:hypothetical protein
MNKRNKYESQALAIAMVVMVVSSIIAMSIFFRAQKDRTLTLEERASAEALEISDLIIDKLTQFKIEDVFEEINNIRVAENKEPFDYVQGTIPPLQENSEYTDITDLFVNLGIAENIRDLSICPASQGTNEYQLTIKEADESTFFEIRAGQVWSLPIKGLAIDNQCQLILKLEVRGSTEAGFVLTKSYVTTDGKYKKYEYDDITSYCFADSSGVCNSQDINFYDNNWQPYEIENTSSNIPIDLTETISVDGTNYILDEIRIKAIGGTVGLSYSSTPVELGCLDTLRMMHLRVTANCYGIYRGKEVLIPQKKWHNTLFDYVIFNAEGSI